MAIEDAAPEEDADAGQGKELGRHAREAATKRLAKRAYVSARGMLLAERTLHSGVWQRVNLWPNRASMLIV